MTEPSPRPASTISPRQLVIGAGVLLVLVQTAFRAWASAGGWFYSDDFEFLAESTGRSLSLHHLMQPHDSHLMPGGVLLSWLVAHAGPFNWSLAGAILVLLQLAAGLSCLVMLVRAFGARWQVLPLLSLYLFSSLTVTAYMWWSAAINQLPFQIAFCWAVTLHLTYLRERSLRHALGAAGVILLGMVFYEKAVLIVGPLLFLTVLWFPARAKGVLRRARATVRRHWLALAAYIVVAVGYLAYYASAVPNPVSGDAPVAYGDVADAMFRRSLGTALIGGPWRWTNDNPPLGQVASPEWAITLAWVVLAVGVAHVVHERRADWRALLVAVPYLLVTYVLTARGRGTALGGFVGLELRYLADAAPVLVLAIGLFCLRLADPPVRSRRRPSPTPPAPPVSAARRRAGRATALVLTGALVVGASVSNVRYVLFWHEPFPAKAFTKTVAEQARRAPLRIADEPVPELVMSATSFPSNLPSIMFAPLGDKVTAVTSGNDLDMLGSTGTVYPAIVTGGAESEPGPLKDCGYGVRAREVSVDLAGQPAEFFWWAELSYVAADDGTLELSVGDSTQELQVEQGAHRFYLKGEGSVQDLSMSSPDTAVCVDQVSIGDISAVEPL